MKDALVDGETAIQFDQNNIYGHIQKAYVMTS